MKREYCFIPSPTVMKQDYIYLQYGALGLGVLYCILSDLQDGVFPVREYANPHDKAITYRCWGDCLTKARQIVKKALLNPFEMETRVGSRAEIYKSYSIADKVLRS